MSASQKLVDLRAALASAQETYRRSFSDNGSADADLTQIRLRRLAQEAHRDYVRCLYEEAGYHAAEAEAAAHEAYQRPSG